jgi:hypothetical protein
VTQDQRTPRHAEVEIAVAVFVDRVSAFASRKTGVPPTLRKARTGLDTPAGIGASARAELGRACLDEFREFDGLQPATLRG